MFCQWASLQGKEATIATVEALNTSNTRTALNYGKQKYVYEMLTVIINYCRHKLMYSSKSRHKLDIFFS